MLTVQLVLRIEYSWLEWNQSGNVTGWIGDIKSAVPKKGNHNIRNEFFLMSEFFKHILPYYPPTWLTDIFILNLKHRDMSVRGKCQVQGFKSHTSIVLHYISPHLPHYNVPQAQTICFSHDSKIQSDKCQRHVFCFRVAVTTATLRLCCHTIHGTLGACCHSNWHVERKKKQNMNDAELKWG